MKSGGGTTGDGPRRGEHRRRAVSSTEELLRSLPCRWCLLRDADPSEGDLEFDVLVGGHPRVVRRTLAAAGAVPIRSWGRAPHRQFTWWDESRAGSVRLDLVDELGFGLAREYVVERRDAVLDASTTRGGWPRPTPSSEQWLALLHGLLDRDRIRQRDIARLDPFVADPHDEVIDGVLPAELVATLHAAAASGDWPVLESARNELRDALRRREPIRSRVRRGWRRAMMRTTKIQRVVLRPGVRIALLGPDGAGKSSTIEALIQAGVVDGSVYLGVAPAERRRRRRSVPGVSLMSVIRRLLMAWGTAAIRRRRGSSIALDRHPLEALIGPPTSKPTTLVRRWVLAHLLPRPEVVVVLMAPAEVLHERKPEHPLDAVHAKRDRYLDLARSEGFPIIDTTRPQSDVVVEIRRTMHEHSGHGRPE